MTKRNFKVGEMLNKRSPNSKTWMNFDGSFTTEIHARVVHYEDEYGNLQDIDTTVFDEADLDEIEVPISKYSKGELAKTGNGKRNRDDFDYQGLKVPYFAKLPRNFKRGYTVGKGKDMLTFNPTGASSAIGYVSEDEKNCVHYQDAWNDTDVCLELTPNGVKETITLKSDSSPSTFTFVVDGNINNLSELNLMPAWLEDAEGTYRDVEQNIREEDGKVYLELIADVEGLVYPIEIDPTVILTENISNTYIISEAPNNNFSNNQDLMIGHDTNGGHHILMKFSLPIPEGSIINTATLSMYQYHSLDPERAGLIGNIRFITSNWNESAVTYANRPNHENTTISTAGMGTTSGWINFNIVSATQRWANGENNNGIIISPNSTPAISTRRFASTRYTENSSHRPYIEITYNAPPTAPIVISPNGGEIWNNLHRISWQNSIDPEGDIPRYEIQLSTNNGSTWKTIVSLTQPNATYYDYNFINDPETSTARIRIRAHDGTSYSPWDESDGVFTIQHNIAPLTPSNLSPSGAIVNRTTTNRFLWKHNDSPNDPQSKADVRWRSQGTTTWNNIVVNGSSEETYLSPNALPVANVEWQVRTYDQVGLVGPWSNLVVFTSSNPTNAPDILSPMSPVNIPRPTIEWTGGIQQSYQIIIENTLNNVVWDTGEVVSTVKARTVGIDLINGATYKIKVRIKDGGGLFSPFSEKNVEVSYTPPTKPTLEVTQGEAWLNLTITNPAPSGTQPEVTGNEIYKLIDGEWIRIAKVANFYRDYAAASEESVQYIVRALGENGTFSESYVNESIAPKLRGVWLFNVNDPEKTLYRFIADGSGRSEEFQSEYIFRQYAGRTKRAVAFGEHDVYDVSVNLQMLKRDDDREKFFEFVKSKATLLYRDGRGRKVYGVIPTLSMDDVFYGNDATLNISEIDYSEEV